MDRKKQMVAFVAVLIIAASAASFFVNKKLQAQMAEAQGILQQEKELTLADFDIRLQVLGGATNRLTDYSKGILFINFWTTWCGYCEREMPDLIRLDKQMRAEGIGMVLV